VDSRFEQLFHGNVSQLTSSVGLHRSHALRLLPIAIPAPRREAQDELNT